MIIKSKFINMNCLPIEINTIILKNCNQNIIREVSKECKDIVDMDTFRIENVEEAVIKNNMLWISIYLSDRKDKINYCKDKLGKYGFGEYAEIMDAGNWNCFGYIFYLSCKYNNVRLFNILMRECLLYPAYLPIMILDMVNTRNIDDVNTFLSYFVLNIRDYQFLKDRLGERINLYNIMWDECGAGYISSDLTILEDIYKMVELRASFILIPVVFATMDYKLLYMLLNRLEEFDT